MTVRRPPLDIWQLVCAITVADRGSVRRAADDLGTHPTRVRRDLMRIESVTGLSLFHRSHAGVRPMREGQRFIKEASRLLRSVNTLSARKGRDRITIGPRLRAGIQAPVIAGRMTAALAACRERQPDLDVRIESRGRNRLLRALDLGHIDVAILAGDVFLNGFETRHLWTERLVVALADSHPLSRRHTLVWAEMRDEVFVTGSDGRGHAFENILWRTLTGLTETPRIVRQKIPQAEIFGFVRAGLGLCLTTDAWREMRIPGLRFVELTGGHGVTHVDYTAAWRHENRSGALDLFLDAASTFAIRAS